DLGQVAAQDRLTDFHLVVGFAWIACAEAGHAHSITASCQPNTYLVGALPCRVCSRNGAAQFTTQIGNILRAQTFARCNSLLDLRDAGNRVAMTLNRQSTQLMTLRFATRNGDDGLTL